MSTAKSTCDVSSDWVREFAADGKLKGIILSGSHASVYEVDDRARRRVRAGPARAGHLLRHADHGHPAGRQGRRLHTREFGYAEVRAHGHTELLKASKTSPRPKATACSRSG
jgi:GMP synthase (glutamine-hydrolysing)